MKTTDYFRLFTVLLTMLSVYSNAQEWTLLNPYPTYHSMLAASFPSHDTGFICGNNSTVLRTTDGGLTWTEIGFPAEGVQLTSINFPTNNRGYIVSWNHLASTIDAGETWQHTQFNLMGDLRSSFFLNDTLGWLSGSYRIVVKTTDGGQTWQVLSNNIVGTQNYQAIAFANPDTGYVAGYIGLQQGSPLLRRSDNGGITWYDVPIPGEVQNIRDLAVLGPEEVWIAAGNTIFDPDLPGWVVKAYHTTDGGQTWTGHVAGPSSSSSGIRKVEFINSQEGRLLGNSAIYTTSDGGQTWVRKQMPYLSLWDFSWTETNHCYIVGWGPVIAKSTDGGESWQNLMQGNLDYLECIYFLDENTGFIGGRKGQGSTFSVLSHTHDGGETWVEAQLDTVTFGSSIRSIAFSSPSVGWAVSYGTRLYKTVDGGYNWQATSTGFPFNLRMISIPDENHIFLASPDTQAVKSEDGGETWQKISPILNDYTVSGGFSFTDSLTGYMGLVHATSGIGKMIKTMDGGLTWDEISYGYPYKILSLSFANNFTGMISLPGTGLLLTTDGGNTWTASPINAPADITHVRMIDSLHAIAGVRGHFLSVTHDGGQTWETFYDGPSLGSGPTSIFFMDEGNGWLCGNSGMLMRFNGPLTGLHQPANTNSRLNNHFFYPNPAGDIIYLRTEKINTIHIYNLEGQLVHNQELSGSASVDISALKPGVYVVIAITPQGVLQQKLIRF